MLLVVDVSVLVSELLRVRGWLLIESPRLRLRVSEEAWEETYHELPKRAGKIVEQGRITQEEGDALLREALDVAARRVVPLPSETYEALKEQASYRIPRDPDDIPTVALALALGGDGGRCGIWTGDNDFLGCGIPTWTTDTLLAHLRYTGRA